MSVSVICLLFSSVLIKGTAVQKIDTREIVRQAVLTALRNPVEEVENFLHKTESNFLSDAGRNLDDPHLLRFCNFVAVPCEDPSADSESCGQYIRSFFHLTRHDYNQLIDAEIVQDASSSLAAYLKKALHNPKVEKLPRIRLVSPLICEFIEYFAPEHIEQKLGYKPRTHSLLDTASLYGQGAMSVLEIGKYSNVMDKNEETFLAALTLLAEARDLFYGPAPVAPEEAQRSIDDFFELNLFKIQNMHELKKLFVESTKMFGIFNIAKIFSPFTDRMMKDIPDSLWVRIAPGTSTLDVELQEWAVRRSQREAGDVEEENDDTARAAFVAEWKRQWGEVRKNRGYRRANAFYTWTRVYVPGALMSLQQSLQRDEEFERAIENDCEEFKLDVSLVKNLVIPGRSNKSMFAYGPKLGFFCLRLLALGASEKQREQVLNKSKILELVARRMKVLYDKALQKEAEYLKDNVNLLEIYRGNSKFENFDATKVPNDSVIEVIFNYILGKFQLYPYMVAAVL